MDTPFTADAAVLTELKATGNHLDAAKLHLASAGTAPNPHMVLADFIECTFTGYAAVAITWAGPIDGISGRPELMSQLAIFKLTDDTAQTVTHWFLTNSDGTVLLAAQQLDTPIPLTQNGSGFGIAISYRRYDGGYVMI